MKDCLETSEWLRERRGAKVKSEANDKFQLPDGATLISPPAFGQETGIEGDCRPDKASTPPSGRNRFVINMKLC